MSLSLNVLKGPTCSWEVTEWGKKRERQATEQLTPWCPSLKSQSGQDALAAAKDWLQAAAAFSPKSGGSIISELWFPQEQIQYVLELLTGKNSSLLETSHGFENTNVS